jgi:hypothetical protein
VNERPTIYRHPARPEWGHGILVEERDAKLILHWEDGHEHVVASAFRAKLEPAELPDSDAKRINDTVRGLRAKKMKTDEKARNRAKVKPRSSTRVQARLSFDEQIARFRGLYPAGFEDIGYLEKERGIRGGQPIDGGKQAAMDQAQTLLAPSALDDAEAGFEAAQKLLGATNLVFPIEGAIPFRGMQADNRPAYVAALKDLLHGDAPFAARFDQYVAALRIEDAKQVAKRPTWPLATLLPALHQPARHAFIKPKLLQEQAGALSMTVNYQPMPSGAVYGEFLAVLEAVDRKLREAGLVPRDLMDVAAFVWTTLAPIKVEVPAPVPAA